VRRYSKEADREWAAEVAEARAEFHAGIASAAEVNLRRVALTLACYAEEVGPGPARNCPPRHPTHFEPFFLEVKGIL
jgi:hypothetical protein